MHQFLLFVFWIIIGQVKAPPPLRVAEKSKKNAENGVHSVIMSGTFSLPMDGANGLSLNPVESNPVPVEWNSLPPNSIPLPLDQKPLTMDTDLLIATEQNIPKGENIIPMHLDPKTLTTDTHFLIATAQNIPNDGNGISVDSNLVPLDGISTQPSQALVTFSDFDVNGDNNIDIKELIDVSGAEKNAQLVFNSLDRNGEFLNKM